VGAQVFFMGREFTITSEREQILDLLISTFEDAVRQNRELRQREEELLATKAELARYAGTLEQRLQSVLESVPDVVFSVNGAMTELYYMSPACKAVLGFTADEFAADMTRWRAAIHPEDQPRVIASYRGALEVGRQATVVYRILPPDGAVRWIEEILVPVSETRGTVVRLDGVARDITERKRAEETIRSQARQQAAVAELGHTALAGGDLSALLDAAVLLVARTLGTEYCMVLELLPDGQALSLRAGTGWKAGHVGTATVPARKESMAGYTLLSGGPVVVDDLSVETRFRGPPLLLEHGVVSGLAVAIGGRVGQFGVLGVHTTRRRVFTADDVHFLQAVANILGTAIERRATELARAQLAAILEATPDLVGTADTDGRLLYMNQAGRRMLGIGPAEDISGLTISDLYAERERPRLLSEVIPTVLREGVWRGEAIFLPRDGREIPVSLAGLAHRPTADSPPFLSAIVRDLTEHKKLEEQFRQAQKMEAVGRLAGGVAHDFNNLLTVITSYSELLLGDLESTDPRRADLEEIRKAAAGAAGLTRQLLAFSRQQVLEPRVLDLNAVVTGAGNMLQRLIGEDVALVTVLAPNLGRVRADPGQLEQVIMNLAVNARDAMPEGGKLTVETANMELDGAYTAEHTPVTPGPYVLLTVSDSGVGMDEETQRRIFEPFFTTKAIGKGTGLGLATVYGIVKQSEGFIWVYSEVGHGTTFKIYLPRVDERADAAQQATALPESVRGTETVLLAEDAAAVRAVARQVLERNGYAVLEAPNGRTALDLAVKHRGPIHLLVTDVIMPEMSGRQLAERLKEPRPELKVLFVSGYTDDAIIRHGILEPGIAFLQKPFSPESLARKVRELLDSPQGPP
jgi:PAS domain S-box-containing protein